MSLNSYRGKVGSEPLMISAQALHLATIQAQSIAQALGLSEMESSMYSYWNVCARVEQWNYIASHIGIEAARTMRFLEIGSGMGLFVLCGSLLGFHIVGVEPSQGAYEISSAIARILFEDNNHAQRVIQAQGNNLPFPDESFDMVVSFQTMEHVQHLPDLLCEVRRILVRGGTFFAQFPNYASFYEPHYGLLAPLIAGKALTRWYLRMLARPTMFLNHLQWITPRHTRHLLDSAGFRNVLVQPAQGDPITHTVAVCDFPPLPYTFSRGRRSHRVAYRVAWLLNLLNISAECFPQIEVWSRT